MAMFVVQSSQWLPMSTVPGTIVAVAWVITYWPPPHRVAVGVEVKVRVGGGNVYVITGGEGVEAGYAYTQVAGGGGDADGGAPGSAIVGRLAVVNVKC